MEIKDLRYFVAAYEAQGFARACVALNTVQSNVSLRIKELEDVLGVSLFVRHSRGIRPTAKGDVLYLYAKRVLELMDETHQAMSPEKAA